MSNVRIKEVIVQLDRPRKLVYDLNAFIELEDIYKSIEGAFKALESKSLKAFRDFLYVGLINEDAEMTPRKAGAILSLGSIKEVSEKIEEAVKIGLPELDKSGKNLIAPK